MAAWLTRRIETKTTMSIETLLSVLEWAVPSGIVGTVTWLVSREVRHASTAKKVHDTYKTMYEDVSSTLTELRQDYDKIYKICTRMERALTRASVCRYWPQCPIRDELPDPPYVSQLRAAGRQYGVVRRERDVPRVDDASPEGLGRSADFSDEPP